MSDSTATTTSIQVLSRMFSLLDTLSREGDSLSLKSISEQTGLHPSTAHRILNDLAVGQLVERSGPGSYRLGLGLMKLGNLVRGRLDVRELATRPMQDLHRLTGHPVSLFMRQEDEVLCAERTVSERSGVQVTRVMGLRLSLTGSAAGKLFLLNESNTSLQALATANGLRLDALQSELNGIRQAGIAIDGDKHDPQHQMAAAAITDDVGKVCASLVLNIAVVRLTTAWREALLQTAQRVSTSMGGGQPR